MEQWVVDAFAERPGEGNPVAVRVVDEWPSDAQMLAAARANGLSETAFARRGSGAPSEGVPTYQLRWFTPGGEIDLCGHATLGAAWVILSELECGADAVVFETMSGRLYVRRLEGGLLQMEFPAYELAEVPVTQAMVDALGARPEAALMGRDLLCVYSDAAVVRAMVPDQARVASLEGLLVHVTAPGDVAGIDCVSRSFGPKLSIAEDPVCGSGHCHVAPYWAARLGRQELVASQASARGGTLWCRVDGPQVLLAGHVVPE